MLRLFADIALVGAAMVQDVAAAEWRRTEPDATRATAFDIPAQSLGPALEAYSVTSGWQVVYNAAFATGRRSSAITGNFTPDAALRMLLVGTGLIPQYKATDSVMLVPDPLAGLSPDEVADTVSPLLQSYFGLIQTRLLRVLCASDQIRSGAYRIALSFRIGPSGHVTQSALLGSTGRADIDERFSKAVGGLAVGAAPPAQLNQPVTLLVTPDLVGKCDAVNADVHPGVIAR